MKSFSGCLVGVLLGIVLSVLVYAGYTILSSSDTLPLLPASSVSNPDLTITISEQYLNDQLRKGLAGRGMKVTDMTVNLHASNRADASMTMSITVLGESINIRPNASIHFGVSNGLVTFDIDKVDVSGFSVPQQVVNQEIGSFKQYGQDEFNAEMKRELANTGLHVVGIESTEGALTLQLSH
jgi:uncharacterized protein YpmS